MMSHEQLSQRLHFYYCAIIAALINERYGFPVSQVAKNQFLLRWLDNAQRNKSFQAELINEIRWLRRKMLTDGLAHDYLPMLKMIYRQGQSMMAPAPVVLP
ncbi:hypothetical protein [Chimaeribacter arupi]|uniref:hypothetical protein n=1 Tax=Chimaeribacter arupi TaxID=2060066 RepID=UPI002945C487|nr:hypothetical protein [Chimaeribacter arupi]MDV5142059.1 hypothetical protein [Chimaeribacter arupi]